MMQQAVTQNMFEVQTPYPLTNSILVQLRADVLKRASTTWLDMVISDTYVVNIMLETTDNVDEVSHTIATIIQNFSYVPHESK